MAKNRWYYGLSVMVMVMAIATGCTAGQDREVSGEIVGGYRILKLVPERAGVSLRVYRGDYIRFDMAGSKLEKEHLSIPAMGISLDLARADSEQPYFKMQQTGSYGFVLGTMAGILEVVEYDKPQYAALTPKEAADLIRDQHPLILDVRLEREYRSGHLTGATLIPVQELQKRISEVAQYKSEPVLIYCASGNRSTVASKILIDEGFKKIYDLKYGIKGWQRENFSVVR